MHILFRLDCTWEEDEADVARVAPEPFAQVPNCLCPALQNSSSAEKGRYVWMSCVLKGEFAEQARIRMGCRLINVVRSVVWRAMK